MVLSMILHEAVEDARIPFNPCRRIRIHKGIRAEPPHATREQVAAIVARQRRPPMVLTAAYSGMRWAELAGLDRDNLDLTAGTYLHPPASRHEVEGKPFLGPPRPATPRIRLPRFLINLLAVGLTEHHHSIVFPGERGSRQRRPNCNRRAWSPAVNGDPARGVSPIHPEMRFHDLRHTHKTWLIED